jgi:hypothetical protein
VYLSQICYFLAVHPQARRLTSLILSPHVTSMRPG